LRFDDRFASALVLLFFAIIFALGFQQAYAAETNVTIDVNVTVLSEITVSPASINWTLVSPGQTGSAVSGVRLLDIHNTGSVNITNIYAFVTTLQNETTRPYGASEARNYSAGGVLVFHNSSSPAFFWAGRIEWNWTGPISNIDLTAIDQNSRSAQGFFRNASTTFVWAVGNGTNGCNDSDAVFAIDSDADLGTAATRAPTTDSITMDGGDLEWAYFSVNREPLNGMCVAINRTCDKIYIYKYDKRSVSGSDFGSCGNSRYIYAGLNLTPGAIETITADVWMPRGMPLGNLTKTIWTFVGS
jgi:hypothetical protein